MPQASQHVDSFQTHNPLDSVEEVLNDNNWIYERMNNEKLLLDVTGSVFSYRLCFVWQEHLNALQILCHYDCAISAENRSLAAETLMHLNSDMWMGHFELTSGEYIPCFRYTSLLHDRNEASVYANIQDVVDICFAQCERYQSVFQILSSEAPADLQILSLAMMDTAGES